MKIVIDSITTLFYEIDCAVNDAAPHVDAVGRVKSSPAWVTLINGHMRTSKDFRMLSQHLVQLGFSVLRVDNRGSGQTESAEGFQIADMANDVLRLWSHLGIKKSHLLGISMGGLIVQIVASLSPKSVESLCLVSTYGDNTYCPKPVFRGNGQQEAPEGEQKDDDSLDGEGASNLQEVRTSLQISPWGESYGDTLSHLTTYFSKNYVEKNSLIVKAMAKQIWSEMNSSEFVARSNAQRLAIDGFALSRLRRSVGEDDMPVLILHGEDDRIVLIHGARQLANLYEKSRLVLFAGCGHLLLAETPKKLYQEVGGFFLNPI